MEEAGDGAKASGEDARGGGAQTQGRRDVAEKVITCCCVLAIPVVLPFENRINVASFFLKINYTKGIASVCECGFL